MLRWGVQALFVFFPSSKGNKNKTVNLHLRLEKRNVFIGQTPMPHALPLTVTVFTLEMCSISSRDVVRLNMLNKSWEDRHPS